MDDLAKSWVEADLGEMHGHVSQAKKDILALQDSNPALFEQINGRRIALATVGEPPEATPDMKLDYEQQRLENSIQGALAAGRSPDEIAAYAMRLQAVTAQRQAQPTTGPDRSAASQAASGQVSGPYGSSPKGGAGPAASPIQNARKNGLLPGESMPSDPVMDEVERKKREVSFRERYLRGFRRSTRGAPSGRSGG